METGSPGAQPQDWRKENPWVYATLLTGAWAFRCGMRDEDRAVARAACFQHLADLGDPVQALAMAQLVEAAWDCWNSGTLGR